MMIMIMTLMTMMVMMLTMRISGSVMLRAMLGIGTWTLLRQSTSILRNQDHWNYCSRTRDCKYGRPGVLVQSSLFFSPCRTVSRSIAGCTVEGVGFRGLGFRV